MQKGYLGNLFTVGGPNQMSFCWSGSRQKPFKLHRGNNVGISSESPNTGPRRIESLKTGSQNDRSNIDVEHLFGVVKIDRTCRAYLFTESAGSSLFKTDAIVSIYLILERHCLGILYIDRLSLTGGSIVFAIDLFRTF